MPGGRLKTGRLVAMTLLGEPLVFGRDHAGAPFALRDNCPHRGVPLSYGAFDGKENRPFVNPVKERTLRWRT